MQDEALPIEVAGETLLLHPDRAAIWPARRTLLIADLHLGKSEFFRRSGIAVPEGATQADLSRLSALVGAFAIERILLLGDFVHAAADSSALHAAALARWRSSHPHTDIAVVAGNHDRRAAGKEMVETVTWLGASLAEPPFVFTHRPQASELGYVFCGHVHPVFCLRGSHRERLRLPVFVRTPHYMVLPSFGSFTGGAEVELSDADEIFAAAAGRVWRVPHRSDAVER